MTVYAVRNKATGTYRMVDANHRSNALSHVASDTFEVTIPSSAEAIALAGQGVVLEWFMPAKARQHQGQEELPPEAEEEE
jgi:hypothetical protein